MICRRSVSACSFRLLASFAFATSSSCAACVSRDSGRRGAARAGHRRRLGSGLRAGRVASGARRRFRGAGFGGAGGVAGGGAAVLAAAARRRRRRRRRRLVGGWRRRRGGWRGARSDRPASRARRHGCRSTRRGRRRSPRWRPRRRRRPTSTASSRRCEAPRMDRAAAGSRPAVPTRPSARCRCPTAPPIMRRRAECMTTVAASGGDRAPLDAPA